jgi:hypothetical protein
MGSDQKYGGDIRKLQQLARDACRTEKLLRCIKDACAAAVAEKYVLALKELADGRGK